MAKPVVILRRRKSYKYGPASTFPVLADGRTMAAIDHGTVEELQQRAAAQGLHVLFVADEPYDSSDRSLLEHRIRTLQAAT